MIIEYITGQIVKIFPNYIVVLTAGGIGYAVYIELQNTNTKENDAITLWTDYRVATDNTIKIYGFLDHNSLLCFRMLCKINRVGPKLAHKIIHHLGIAQFYHALYQQDIDIIKSIPGVGAMTAKSILLESATMLKDQLDTKETTNKKKTSTVHDSLQQTLLNMGYDQNHIQSVDFRKIDTHEPFDKQLIHALSLLSPFFSE